MPSCINFPPNCPLNNWFFINIPWMSRTSGLWGVSLSQPKFKFHSLSLSLSVHVPWSPCRVCPSWQVRRHSLCALSFSRASMVAAVGHAARLTHHETFHSLWERGSLFYPLLWGAVRRPFFASSLDTAIFRLIFGMQVFFLLYQGELWAVSVGVWGGTGRILFFGSRSLTSDPNSSPVAGPTRLNIFLVC